MISNHNMDFKFIKQEHLIRIPIIKVPIFVVGKALLL